MNETPALTGYCYLDERDEFDQQADCQRELDALLAELDGLILIAEMPEGTRARLLDGLDHLRGHIHCETRHLEMEIYGRLN